LLTTKQKGIRTMNNDKTKEKRAGFTPGGRMKQTTILCEIVEEIFGAYVEPKLMRGAPGEHHVKAWNLISNTEGWVEKRVEPKENETDDVKWYEMLGERLLRVCGNRSKFQTRACVHARWPNGNVRTVRMTVLWDRPRISPLDRETYGEWTLRLFEKGKRTKIVSRHRGVLECDGDELHDALPDDARNFECEPDGRSILYYDSKDDGDTDWKYYEFRFQPKRKEKLAKADGGAEA